MLQTLRLPGAGHVDALNIAHVLLACCPAHAHPLAHPHIHISIFFAMCRLGVTNMQRVLVGFDNNESITTTVDKPPILHAEAVKL